MRQLRYWLVLPAAGRGERFSAILPKQYTQLNQITLLEWALKPFIADTRCVAVVVALGAEDVHWPPLKIALMQHYPKLKIITVQGGAARCDSVQAALLALCEAGAVEADWVLVHDAARPCVTRTEIDALLEDILLHSQGGAQEGGLLALPITDTVKCSEVCSGAAQVALTLNRDSLWRALTPQMFRLGALLHALRAASDEARIPTDEAQAMEWQGARPRLVNGDSSNIKVTTFSDLALADSILRSRIAPAQLGGAVL
ncbi:MAG: 2-C-methyl-D-erythritol 4-phosphate cytidylyltransferase [Gammaproteobacteria bacterium]|nr:2-C-methyl-D-erythritol 4-phosphate cytidylyltransferase [Gammaproteobacteria bacterium]